VRKIPTRYLLHIIPLKPEERAVFSARQRADVRFEKHDPNGNQIELFCAEPGIGIGGDVVGSGIISNKGHV
jgi:hypothetical protein